MRRPHLDAARLRLPCGCGIYEPMTRADRKEVAAHSELRPSDAKRLYIASAILSGLGLLGKSSLLVKVTHLPSWFAVSLVAISLCLCFFWRLALRFSKVLAPTVFVLLLAFFWFIFPRVQDLHKQGRGSDQADCVITAANRSVQRAWPYEPSEMPSRNAMSCGPGWVALQVPAIYVLGYRWNLIICLVVSLIVIGCQLGWERTAAITTLIGLSPGTWLTAANGSDFLTFGIALLAFCVVVGSAKPRRSSLFWSFAAVVLGLISQFRFVTLWIPAFFLKQMPRVAAIGAWAIGTAFQLGFLLWNPYGYVHNGPLHIAAKLMRMGIMSNNTAIAAVELCFASGVGFVVLSFLAARTRSKRPLLLFLFFIFLLPGCQDLILKYRLYGNILKALEFWEGGIWIQACVPLAAASLVAATSHVGRERAEFQAIADLEPGNGEPMRDPSTNRHANTWNAIC
jgi:hypothetical protein